MAGTEVVANFVRRNTHSKRRNCFPIGNAIRVGWAAANNAGPGHARRATQVSTSPHMGDVAARAGKVRIPVTRKLSQDRRRVTVRGVGIVRSVPGMLKADSEREAYVAFKDSLDLIHDTQDVAIRRGRTSQGTRIFEIGFGGHFGEFERREGRWLQTAGGAGH